MAPVDAQNSTIPEAISPKMEEELSKIGQTAPKKFHADR